jgi:hypothetical protein
MPGNAVTGRSGHPTVALDGQRDDWPKFDYASVPKSVANFLQGESERIRRQYTNSIVQIGKALLGTKRYLSHGSFIAWVEAEVGMPARTAQAYMRVAQWASGKSASVAHLPPVVLYLLSASNTPPDFARRIIERVEAGDKIALADLRKELRDYREAESSLSQQQRLLLEPAKSAEPAVCGVKTFASLEEAVTILARELSEADFLRVKSAFTDRYIMTDPNFASHITSLFKARESLRRDH